MIISLFFFYFKNLFLPRRFGKMSKKNASSLRIEEIHDNQDGK